MSRRLMCKWRRLMRRMGYQQRHCHGHCKSNHLNDVEPSREVIIASNQDHRTLERGLCTGRHCRVLRNHASEPNIIVAVGDARYALDRRIARTITVQDTVSDADPKE